MEKISRGARSFALAALLVTGALSGCQNTDNTLAPLDAGQINNPTSANLRGANGAALAHAMDVQNRHSDELMTIDGVNGTGTGLNEDGTPAIYVFTTRKNVVGIPSSVEGIRTKAENIGNVTAFSGIYTGVYRSPMPSGVSVGNDKECSAGTIGCVVTDKGGINRYLLSNNHVFARLNKAAIGERIDQPGRYDAIPKCSQTGQVASLSRFIPINFNRRSTNTVDCAIALIVGTPGQTTRSIVGYSPNTNTETAAIGLAVKKTGRTTGLTSGKISAINVKITVWYGWGLNATFVNQMYVASKNRFSSFSGFGDSGSLIVDDSGTGNEDTPVGLLFAGSPCATIANPIQSVLTQLGVTIVSDRELTSASGFQNSK